LRAEPMRCLHARGQGTLLCRGALARSRSPDRRARAGLPCAGVPIPRCARRSPDCPAPLVRGPARATRQKADSRQSQRSPSPESEHRESRTTAAISTCERLLCSGFCKFHSV
jgi:hypothetical protein